MKDASQYPISFPYGATTDPYSPAHPHRGDDRACPVGTPVIINGVTIGLTGATGKVTGPHLHIQEWHNNYLDIRKPQNAFKGGVVTNIDPTQSQGDGSFGKFISVKTADGWTDSYCHLSRIDVKVGDKLEGEEMFNEGDRVNLNNSLYGQDLGLHKGLIGKPFKEAIYDIFLAPEDKDARLVNGGDVYNYFRFFAGHDPADADLAYHVGKTHKATIYDLMQRQDVQQHCGNSTSPPPPPAPVPPTGTVNLRGAPASVSWSKDRIDVVACGEDESLWHIYWTANKGWQAWENLTELYKVGKVQPLLSISSYDQERLDIFSTGVAGDLVHIWYNGKWNGPESLNKP